MYWPVVVLLFHEAETELFIELLAGPQIAAPQHEQIKFHNSPK
tara:strand:- start:1192 stop:1320 length:129 start_codon:yes stop_codon:yes gene_type:complete